MIDKCKIAATEIADIEALNTATVTKTVNELGNLRVNRMIVTDHRGVAIYDSNTENKANGSFIFLPEIVQSMDGYDVFSWYYKDGTMCSKAATPILSYGTLIGCVYMMEYDAEQGALIQTLQHTTLIITAILEIAVIIFSLFFSTAFTRRLRKIMESIRIIRAGDYTHKLDVGGSDELTVLGDEFNDLVDRLRTSEQKRNNFVSDASHELKTPLASIKLLADSIMQNDMDADTIREFVGDIGNEAERLNRMSQKLLTLAKVEAQIDNDYEIIELSPTIHKVHHMLNEIATKNEVTIDLNIVKDSPVLIVEDDLYQIVFNLVENGIKYNKRGGSLQITLQREADNAVLSFRDSGMGIPQDSIPHIFERFYRVEKARSRKSGGSGLGLSIVRNLIEKNNGCITVDSIFGEGTTFTVTFPVFDTEEEP